MTTREQLIEVIGKPIHEMRFNGDRYATIEIIMEVLTAIEAAGLCIVPVEATEAMIERAHTADPLGCDIDAKDAPEIYGRIHWGLTEAGNL